jgi:CheY-like chemotaxis protein
MLSSMDIRLPTLTAAGRGHRVRAQRHRRRPVRGRDPAGAAVPRGVRKTRSSGHEPIAYHRRCRNGHVPARDLELVRRLHGGRARDPAATRPDVVILDYRLPVMNGIEATRAIRTSCPGTEVLIFTMHGGRHLIRRLLEAGARGYLSKSEARRFLIPAVEALSRHEPFFTDSVPRDLLDVCLGKPASTPD